MRDLVALAKPRITALVVFTTLTGIYLAPGRLPLHRAFLALAGTVMAVAGANALNMYLERDSDGRMNRTRNRPLPAGRMEPVVALWFGVLLGLAALPILAVGVNLLTAALGAIALLSYVLVYTPMKRRSPAALLVGAVPGAIPPLMGWTAATGRIDLPGALLFAVMFVWQVPHFLAIGLYAQEDYARGGIQVLPLVAGEATTKLRMVVYSGVLVPLGLSLYPAGVGGVGSAVVALVGGLAFFGWSLRGLLRPTDRAWARQVFYISLVYLTLLFIVLALEGRLRG